MTFKILENYLGMSSETNIHKLLSEAYDTHSKDRLITEVSELLSELLEDKAISEGRMEQFLYDIRTNIFITHTVEGK